MRGSELGGLLESSLGLQHMLLGQDAPEEYEVESLGQVQPPGQVVVLAG